MKKLISLLIALGIVSIQGVFNLAFGDADVFINTSDPGSIDFSGRTFGGAGDDDTIVNPGPDIAIRKFDNLVSILGGRIRKVKRGKNKTYITIEFKNTDKNLKAFGGTDPLDDIPIIEGTIDVRKAGIRYSTAPIPNFGLCAAPDCYGPLPLPTSTPTPTPTPTLVVREEAETNETAVVK